MLRRIALAFALVSFAASAAEPEPSSVFVPARLIKQVDVRPSKWGIAGYDGKVIVACFIIATDGKVKDVTFANPDRPEFLDVPIRRALIRWRFEPATRDGVPVEQPGCYEVRIRQLGG